MCSYAAAEEWMFGHYEVGMASSGGSSVVRSLSGRAYPTL